MSEEIKMDPGTIFTHLEEILKTSEDIIKDKKEIEILLSVRQNNRMKGLAKVGEEILPFCASLKDDGRLNVMIGTRLFTFSPETIMKMIERMRQNE